MLIMTKDREILNLDNVLEIRASEENVECELMNGYIYIIQSFKTHKKAEDALDKILNQYDRGQRTKGYQVIKVCYEKGLVSVQDLQSMIKNETGIEIKF